MTLTEAQTHAAVTHARFAARRDLPMTSCPYVGRQDDTSRALTQVWVRAYLVIRPPAPDAVVYTDDGA